VEESSGVGGVRAAPVWTRPSGVGMHAGSGGRVGDGVQVGRWRADAVGGGVWAHGGRW
jgi:hypothetical protein